MTGEPADDSAVADIPQPDRPFVTTGAGGQSGGAMPSNARAIWHSLGLVPSITGGASAAHALSGASNTAIQQTERMPPPLLRTRHALSVKPLHGSNGATLLRMAAVA